MKAIKTSIIHNQKLYASKLINQYIKLIGKIIAKINIYVGLQLPKTGQREAHTNISQIIHHFVELFHNNIFDLFEKPILIFFQK